MMITKEILAKMLEKEFFHGVNTFDEMTSLAKENGLIIIFGIGDSHIGIKGAVYDIYTFNDAVDELSQSIFLTREGVSKKENEGKKINVFWCNTEEVDNKGNFITWTFQTEIPHATFMMYDGSEAYCRGLVISIADL